MLVLLLSALLGGCAVSGNASSPSGQAARERLQVAQAMFLERCKTAGEKIYRTVDNVEGVFLMKLRPDGINYGEQFKMNDPYGRDAEGLGYFETLLKGSFPQGDNYRTEWPPRKGYFYVEAIDPKDGQRYRYTGARRAVGRMDPNAPNVQVDLKRDPNFDLNIYRFVLDKVAANGPAQRYGVTYDDISTKEERDYWIAGSSLRIIDFHTNEVIAERIGYMLDLGQGSTHGGRAPWLAAADYACPNFHRFANPVVRNPGFSGQLRQTQDFVEKVLKPLESK